MKKPIEIVCTHCTQKFELKQHIYRKKMKRNKNNNIFCSKQCFYLHQAETKSIIKKCEYCGEEVIRQKHWVNESETKRFFCNKSHAASYNNKLKRKSRRSKIETKFYNLLVKEFPDLNMLANDKTMLDGLETDIAIPELKLAIEWNGIVHFKPIYGQTKLDKVQSKDAEKLKIAANKDINLVVITDLVSNDKILKQAFDDVKIIIEDLRESNGT